MNPLTAASTQRRYIFITALRWLPLGISIPVTVLLASSRALSAADIGLVFATHSVVALVLEMPTGGLADAIGRRPVLVLSGLLHIAGLLTLAFAQGLLSFAIAFALVGAGRALDSGPLESWYVDAVHLLEPGGDPTPGLARAGVANGAGLAVGTVVGGLAPVLADQVGASGNALMLPFLVAAALEGAYLIAVLILVTPIGPTSEVSATAAIRLGVRQVPTIVTATVRLAAEDRVLRRMLIITFLIGVVLSTLELIGPLRLAELAGGPTAGTAVFGIVMAVSFTTAALGAALATRTRRAARGSVAFANAAVFTLCAVAVIGAGLATATVLVGAAYACFYLFNGMGWPMRQQLMHTRVDAAHRATTVSANSFALMIGGVTGSLLMPRLAEYTSLSVALLAAAGPVLVAGLLAIRLRSGGRAAEQDVARLAAVTANPG